MPDFSVVEAELTFIPSEQGGRLQLFPHNALRTRAYRPHIVLGDIKQREPIVELVNSMRQIQEKYLAVAFCDGPELVPFGQPIRVRMILMYYPDFPYSEVVPGSTFTLREGGQIVGYGTITSRYMEPLPAAEDGC